MQTRRFFVVLTFFLMGAFCIALPITALAQTANANFTFIGNGGTVTFTDHSAVIGTAFDFENNSLPSGWNVGGYSNFAPPSCASTYIPANGTTGHYWAGTAGSGLPYIETNGFDLSSGGQIEFRMAYSEQGGGFPCEGPDLSHEGVYLQYSANGGSWTQMEYWNPNGGCSGCNIFAASWQDLSFVIPQGAISSNTRFRWVQTSSSGSCCDNWGVDDIYIPLNISITTWAWNFGDGTTSSNPNPSHTYGSSGTYTVSLAVEAANGTSDTYTTSVVVDIPDVPPVLSGLGQTINYTEDDAATVINSGLTIADSDGGVIAGARVYFSSGYVSSEDVLSYTTTSGITGTWNASSGVLTLTGNGVAADYQAALRAVMYHNTNTTNPSSHARQITYIITDKLGMSHPDGTTHYYEYETSSQITWQNAKVGAENKSLYGLTGYLATITSQQENQFAAEKIQGLGWFGASDAASENTWRWVTGPEGLESYGQGRHFFTQTGAGGYAINNNYSHWAGGEPNQAGNEDYAHFYTNGNWNDFAYNNTSIAGYVVEYGGMPGGPTLQITGLMNINVIPVNDAPYFTSTAVTAVNEDAQYSYTISVVDPEGDAVTLTGTLDGVSFTWLTLSGSVLSGIPGHLQTNTGCLTGGCPNSPINAVVLTATDNGSPIAAAGTQSFNIAVTDLNDLPYFTSSPNSTPGLTASEGMLWSYTVTFTDEEQASGDLTIAFSSVGHPSWLTLTDHNNGTATLSGTPDDPDAGNNPVALTLWDGVAQLPSGSPFIVEQIFTLNVLAVNDPPVIGSIPTNTGGSGTSGSHYTCEATEDVTWSYDILYSDEENGVLTLSATLDGVAFTGSPLTSGWLTLTNHGNGAATLSGTPLDNHEGTHAVIFSVTDNGSPVQAVSQYIDITVERVNDTPYFTSVPVLVATEDQVYSYTLYGYDEEENNDGLAFGGQLLPSWLSIQNVGGVMTLTGTPEHGDVLNQAGDEVVTNFGITLSVTDHGLPYGSGNTRSLLQTFVIVVTPVNDAPIFTSTPFLTAPEDVLWSYNVSATDEEGDHLDFTLTTTTTPVWPTPLALTDYNNSTALLTGIPGANNVVVLNALANNGVVITVTDATTPVTQSFTIPVGEINDPPKFTSTVVITATEDEVYTYHITTSDEEGNTLAITASGLPSWLTLTDNADGTGTLTGTPLHADLSGPFTNTVFNVFLEVTETNTSPALQASQSFTITVTAVNDDPIISTTPTHSGGSGTSVDPYLSAGTEDVYWSYSIAATDEEGEAIAITATIDGDSVPTQWVTITDNGNGTALIYGTPIWEDTEPNVYPAGGPVHPNILVITVDPATGNSVTQTIDVNVAYVNDPPYFISIPTGDADSLVPYISPAMEGIAWDYDIIVVDEEGEDIIFGAYSRDGINFVGNDSDLDFAPPDSIDGSVSSGDTITLKSNGPIPNAGGGFSFPITIEASDGTNTVTQDFDIAVIAVNDPPSITSTVPGNPSPADAGTTYVYDLTVLDLDDPNDGSGALTFSLSDEPTGMTISNRGQIRWNTSEANQTACPTSFGPVTVTVRDGGEDGTVPATQDFTVYVGCENNDPIISPTVPAQGVAVGGTMTLDLNNYETDPDWDDNDAELTWTVPGFSETSSGSDIFEYNPGNLAFSGVMNVTLTLSDGTATDTQNLTLTWAANNAPVWSGAPTNISTTEDALYSQNCRATDTDGNNLTYSVVTPTWLSFPSAAVAQGAFVILSGTPDNSAVGTVDVILSVTDGMDAVIHTFTLTVDNAADPLVVALPGGNVAFTEGDGPTLIDGTATVDDPDDPDDPADLNGGRLTVTITANGTANDTLSIRNVGSGMGQIGFTPGTVSYEGYAIGTVTGGTGTNPLVVTFTTADATVEAAQALLQNITFDNGSDDPDTTTRTVSVVVNDSTGNSNTPTIDITVAGANSAPNFTSTPSNGTEGTLWTYGITTLDPEGDDVTLSAVNLPSWLTFNGTADTLSGTLDTGVFGVDQTFDITIKATDDGTPIRTGLQQFTLTMVSVNDNPSITSVPSTTTVTGATVTGGDGTLATPFLLTATEDIAFSYHITAFDEESGNQLTIGTFDAVPTPWTFHNNGVDAVLSGTPLNAHNTDNVPGGYTIQVTVSDDNGVTFGVSQYLTITVAPVNDPPVFASDPNINGDPLNLTVDEDNLWIYPVVATDEEGDNITFSGYSADGVDFPVGSFLSFSGTNPSGTGVITLIGTPDNDYVGTYPVTISAGDGTSTVLQTFDLTIGNTNDAPSITSSPDVNATEDQPWTYHLTASDIDPTVTSFTFTGTYNGAALTTGWLTLENNGDGTAVLTGTPLNAHTNVGTGNMNATNTVAITVSDGDGGTSSAQVFDILVTFVNDPPYFISIPTGDADSLAPYISPGTENASWQYDIIAFDEEGDSLAFDGYSVDNLSFVTNPSDLSFTGDNPTAPGDTTIILGGTPPNAAGGVDFPVTITVSDGNSSAAQFFYIDVAGQNDPPNFTSTPPDTTGGSGINSDPYTCPGAEDVEWCYAISASDMEGDNVTFTLTGNPGWLTLTDNGDGTAMVCGTPLSVNTSSGPFHHSATNTVEITATDDGENEGGGSDSLTITQYITIDVVSANDPPWFNAMPETLYTQEGAQWFYDFTAHDEELTDLTFLGVSFVSGDPYDIGFGNPNCDTGDSCVIRLQTITSPDSLIPAAAGGRNFEVVISASDQADTTVSGDVGTQTLQSFVISVAAVNDAPYFTSAADGATEDMLYTYDITAEDVFGLVTEVEGDELTITCTTRPSWLTFTDNGDGTATLTGTPTNDDVGVTGNDVVLTVADNGQPSMDSTQTFAVDVAAVNDAPVISVSQSGIFVGSGDPPNDDILINGFEVSDVDISDSLFTGTVITDVGILTVTAQDSAQVINNRSSSITLTGSLDDFNATLATLRYTTNEHSDYDDVVVLTVSDQGNSGDENPAVELTDTATLTVQIRDLVPPVIITNPDIPPIELTVEGIIYLLVGQDTLLSKYFLDDSTFDNCALDTMYLTKTSYSCYDDNLDEFGGQLNDFLILTCADIGTFDAIFTAIDVSGNMSTATVSITVTNPDTTDLDHDGMMDNCDENVAIEDSIYVSNASYSLTFGTRRAVCFTPPLTLDSYRVADVLYGEENEILPSSRVYTRGDDGVINYLGGDDYLQSGQGYYVKTGERVPVDVPFTGIETSEPVSRERGEWGAFFTGNPYNTPIPLSNFVLEPDMPSYFAVYRDGVWRTDIDPVDPGSVVRIYTLAECLRIWKTDPPITARDDGFVEESNDNGWELQLQASIGDLSDSDNSLGVHKKADQTYDPNFDYPELLSLESEYIRVNFPHEWENVDAALFQKDVRSPFDGSESWELEVQTNAASGAVELSWPNMNDLNENLQFTLVNIQTGEEIDMRQEQVYEFGHTFDSNEEVENRVSEIDAYWDGTAIPFVKKETPRTGQAYKFEIRVTGDDGLAGPSGQNWTYRLDQNMPNPFSPMTTIHYQLPEKQEVLMSVYNVTGQLTRTLVRGEMEAGNHHVTWDGTNSGGSSVSSGVYFYRIETSGFKQTKRMVLMR